MRECQRGSQAWDVLPQRRFPLQTRGLGGTQVELSPVAVERAVLAKDKLEPETVHFTSFWPIFWQCLRAWPSLIQHNPFVLQCMKVFVFDDVRQLARAHGV